MLGEPYKANVPYMNSGPVGTLNIRGRLIRGTPQETLI